MTFLFDLKQFSLKKTLVVVGGTDCQNRKNFLLQMVLKKTDIDNINKFTTAQLHLPITLTQNTLPSHTWV